MATCGHCGRQVKGIRDHIRTKHGEPFYERGADNLFYGYMYLKKIHEGLVIDRPHWNAAYEVGPAGASPG